MMADRKPMTSLTRAEIAEIERRKREENNARLRELYGFGGSAKHPKIKG